MSMAKFQMRQPIDTVSSELWDKITALDPSPVSDTLHAYGLHNQVMRFDIQALDPAAMLAGCARTMISQPLVGDPQPGKEYELLFAAIDGLRVGEILVTDRMDCCVWGELCTEAAISRGGNGVVIDGFTRDAAGVKELGFPLYCRGRHMSDLLYHRTITGIDEAIICGDVPVRPGDLLMGGGDGVVVVPRQLIVEVITEAYEKSQTESKVRLALRNGMSAGEAYKKYGVM